MTPQVPPPLQFNLPPLSAPDPHSQPVFELFFVVVPFSITIRCRCHPPRSRSLNVFHELKYPGWPLLTYAERPRKEYIPLRPTSCSCDLHSRRVACDFWAGERVNVWVSKNPRSATWQQCPRKRVQQLKKRKSHVFSDFGNKTYLKTHV